MFDANMLILKFQVMCISVEDFCPFKLLKKQTYNKVCELSTRTFFASYNCLLTCS